MCFHQSGIRGLGGGSGEATEKELPKGCSDPVALTSTDQGEPALHLKRLPCHHTSRKYVIHGGLWAAEKGVTVTSWEIHLLEKHLHCFCFPFCLSSKFVIRDAPRIMDVLSGGNEGGRVRSRVLIFFLLWGVICFSCSYSI